MSAKRKTMPQAMVWQGSPQQNKPLGSHITLRDNQTIYRQPYNHTKFFGQPMVVAALTDTLTICLASFTNMVLHEECVKA